MNDNISLLHILNKPAYNELGSLWNCVDCTQLIRSLGCHLQRGLGWKVRDKKRQTESKAAEKIFNT